MSITRKNDTIELFHMICRCPIYEDYYNNPENRAFNPCQKILCVQEKKTIHNSFPPEPWMEDLYTAKILFIGINPTINNDEINFPNYSKTDQEIFNYLANRWKRSVEHESNTLGYRDLHGKWIKPRYWGEIKTALQYLYDKDNISEYIKKGEVSLIDVVHCKSERRKGVMKSLTTCVNLYLDLLLDICPADIFIVSGFHASLVMKLKYKLKEAVYQQAEICGKKRHIILRAAPNSRFERKLNLILKNQISREDLMKKI